MRSVRLDKRCILQTESETGTWVDRTGVAHQLVDMSPAYRANVLEHLRQQADAWIHGARTMAITLALYGAIAPAQANREIAAVRALPPRLDRSHPPRPRPAPPQRHRPTPIATAERSCDR